MTTAASATRRPVRWLALGALFIGVAGVLVLAPGSADLGVLPAAPDMATDAVSMPGDRATRRRQLEQQVKHDPRDGRAWALLAYDDFEAARYGEAAASFEKAIAASRKVAADPGLLCDYADALGMTQGGSLEGRPSEWIERALALEADHPKALEMAGSAAYGRRDFAGAARYWQQLRPQLAPGSPQQQALDTAIARAHKLAGTSLRVER